MLRLRRGHWVIKGKCELRLDVSLHEEQSRVRSVSGEAGLKIVGAHECGAA